MTKPKVVILASAGITTNLLVEEVEKHANIGAIFIEKPVSKKTIIKGRIKKVGVFKTLGQLAFLTVALPLIPNRKKRLNEIIANAGYSNRKFTAYTEVQNIHQPEVLSEIQRLNPDLVLINGTRILKKEWLLQVPVKLVNIHVGITPKYRGIHGGYWAIYQNDLANFGVTLHFVDAGIDSGKIISQSRFQPSSKDNFKTYPILQYCEGLILLSKHFNSIISNDINPVENIPIESQLHFHPTLGQYIFGRAK